MPDRLPSFKEVLNAAINDMASRGYTSVDQIDAWVTRLRVAAQRDMGSDRHVSDATRRRMEAVFRRTLRGSLPNRVPVGRYTLAMIEPELRLELDRRILASIDLIRMNREEAITSTLRRFSGWATAIPPGGGLVDKKKVHADIGKPVAKQTYERRRVDIDQGHKLVSNVAAIAALGNGAIAAEWSHVPPRAGYTPRPEHVARDGQVLLIRDSWAHKEGLVRAGRAGFVDEVERPGELPFCSCHYLYIVSPRKLPDGMLTAKGHRWIEEGVKRTSKVVA